MARRYHIRREVDERVNKLLTNFDDYLNYCEKRRRLKTNRDRIFRHGKHAKTIELRTNLGSVRVAISSDEFLNSLWNTLDQWGMNSRKAELQSKPTFRCSLRSNVEKLVEFESKRVADIDDDLASKLWCVIVTLKLARSDAQIVTGAKALHHVFPNLLPPIDARHIGRFFKYPSFSANNQEAAFREIVSQYAKIANFLDDNGFDWKGHIGRTDMATSESKLIDNAIIGYVKKHNL